MMLLLQLAFSTVVAGSGPAPLGPIADPFSSYEDAVAFLVGEHRLSVPLYFVQIDPKLPVTQAAIAR